MLWILENGLSDFSYQWLKKNLDNKKIEHMVVKPVPYSNILLSPEFDTFEREPSEGDNLVFDEDQPIFPFGAMGLIRIAEHRGWKPGSLNNENFTFERWSEGFGKENLLNGDSQIMKFSDELLISDDAFFVRPCADDKSFAGMAVSRDQFIDWRDRVIKIDDPLAKLNKDTMITVASYKQIFREARLFVFDGRVVTASYYKIGPKVQYEPVDDYDTIIAYANKMAQIYQPARAFVIDVALTNEGYKVVEINNLNSVGLYRADVDRFVDAVMSLA